MYSFRFTLVLAGLGVGLAYVFLGASGYFTGYRTDRPRLKQFGNTLLTRSPTVIVGAAIGYLLLTIAGRLSVVALAVVVVAALVPPIRALMVALDGDERATA